MLRYMPDLLAFQVKLFEAERGKSFFFLPPSVPFFFFSKKDMSINSAVIKMKLFPLASNESALNRVKVVKLNGFVSFHVTVGVFFKKRKRCCSR